MENVTIPTEIARSATACKEVLDTHSPEEHTWIRSAQVDFNFWCSAIKATSFDRSGLDYRLRNYPDARESICNLLDALKTSVEGAVRIYSGIAKELEDGISEDSGDYILELVDENDVEAPDWDGELEDSDSTQESDEVQSSSTKSEALPNEEPEIVEDGALSNSGSISTNNSILEEYISYVRTILDQLTRISLTIRRSGAKYRFERADKALKETEEVKTFRQHLTTIINSGFPDKDAEGLPATEKMKRVYDDSKFSPVKLKLIRANILRRHRIEYFTKARASRTRAPVEAPNEVQVQRQDKTPAAVDSAPPTSIVSSKVKESQSVAPVAPQVHEVPVERTRSIYTAAVTATDVGPNFDTTDLSANKTPSRITRITKIGESQTYPRCPKPLTNGTLICPYCNDKLPASYANNEQTWKAHVAQDILPYSCIMEECSNDNEMYLKADQLLAHMRAKHSLTKWTCNPCSTNTKQTSESGQSDSQALVFFDSAESWLAHTEKEHGNLGPAPQRDILTELSKRQLIGPLECPLCDSEPTEPSTGIDEHILKHLHDFALRALPGDTGPSNEKESTAFQISSSASLLSYTKDNWTANVDTPDDNISSIRIRIIFGSINSDLKRFGPELNEKVRIDLTRCLEIMVRYHTSMERKLEHPIPDKLLQIHELPFVNLMEAWHTFNFTDEIRRVRDQTHPPLDITLEMKQDILNAAMERVFDIGDSEKEAIDKFLNLLKRKVKYPINFPFPSPGPDRFDIEDIAERIDTGLTNDTDLTRHCNKYKNSPMPLGEEFRKPTKDNVGLVRHLSLLPNIILTGHDPEKITKATVELVDELKGRVEGWSILWVDAGSVASIQKSYVQILETLIGSKLSDEFGGEISRYGAKALSHYLSWTYEGLWIMVFDGLDAEGAMYLRLDNILPRSCAGTCIISTTDPTSAQLLGTAEVIQLPEADPSFEGNRYGEADASFHRNISNYHQLREHLAAIILLGHTTEPRDVFEDMECSLKLDPIQERLVMANLKRRHRFMEAQRHSRGLLGPSTKASNTLIPEQLVAMPTITRQSQSRSTSPGKNPPVISATSAPDQDSKCGGIRTEVQTRIAIRYPRVHIPPSIDQELVKCPCCCQTIPATERDGIRWRQHLANDLCPYTCVLENCPTPSHLFATKKEWNDHVTNDHSPHWQCPCCESDPPIFKSLSGITSHITSEHPNIISSSLDALLLNAETKVTGIIKCPLCDSGGPQDSPDLVEHVLQHVHEFSLRSLPWPMDLPLSLYKPVGTFDIGNENSFHITKWVESVPPFINSEGKLSLQLCIFDQIPSTASEEESALMAHYDQDYFSQNVYFVDAPSTGQLSSQASHSPSSNIRMIASMSASSSSGREPAPPSSADYNINQLYASTEEFDGDIDRLVDKWEVLYPSVKHQLETADELNLMNRFAEILVDNGRLDLATSIDENINEILESDTGKELDEWNRDRFYSLINERWSNRSTAIQADSPAQENTSSAPLSGQSYDPTFGSKQQSQAGHWQTFLENRTHKFMYGKDERFFGTNGIGGPAYKPIKIAVLDSDISPPHLRPFRMRIKARENFAGGQQNAADTDHGTTVAELVLKTCPTAHVYIARVTKLNASGQSAVDFEAAAKAIEFAADPATWGVDIITMPFGWKHVNLRISEALSFAKQHKVLMFASTTNDGFTETHSILYPGRVPEVICVDAAEDTGQLAVFAIDYLKQWRPEKFSAPGLGIISPISGQAMDESSFACPIAAGVAALALEFTRQFPLCDSKSVQEAIQQREGMVKVLKEMSKQNVSSSSKFLCPWKLLSDDVGIYGGDGQPGSERYFVAYRFVRILRQEYGPHIGREIFHV